MAQSMEQRESRSVKAAGGGKPRLRDRSVTITLSVPKAVFGVLFFLFVLVWVFIFGILLGRGHNPEEIVPELAKAMPAPSGSQPAPPPATDGILQPQDLKYHDSLKGKGATPPPRANTPDPQKPAQQTPAPKPAAVPPKPVEPSPAQTAPPKATPVEPAQDQTVYSYTYQVAAFNNSQQAKTLQQKLHNNGLNAKTTETQANGKTWFRVLVNFRGKSEDTRTLREKLSSLGISNVILRGKTPAN